MADKEQQVAANTNSNKRKTVGKILFRVGGAGSIISALLLFLMNYLGSLDLFDNDLFAFVLVAVCILVLIISLPMIVVGIEMRRERHAGMPSEQQASVNTRGDKPNEQQALVNTHGNKGKNVGRTLFWAGFIGLLISLMVLMAHPADENYIGEAFIGIGGCLIAIPVLLIGLALIIASRQ